MEYGLRLTATGGGGGEGALKGRLVEVCRQGFQSNPDSGLGGNLIF